MNNFQNSAEKSKRFFKIASIKFFFFEKTVRYGKKAR